MRLIASLRALAAMLACALALLAPAALAQDDVAARVARVADVQGVLYHAPADRAEDWSEIGQNFPIADGDNLWVARDGRAEVDYGGGTDVQDRLVPYLRQITPFQGITDEAVKKLEGYCNDLRRKDFTPAQLKDDIPKKMERFLRFLEALRAAVPTL
jgi:hypothetical protein